MILQEYNWFMNLIRDLFMIFDTIIYWIMKWILYITFDLANLTTSSSILTTIYQRVYVILTVFMAFKLSFSFFQYIINPQSMKDQKKGIGKLTINLMLMLAALIAIPTIVFGVGSDNGGLLARGQKAFLPMVPRIILGIDGGNNGASASSNSLDKAAEDMTAATMGAFYAPSIEGDESARAKCNKKESDFKTYTTLKEMREHVNDTCNAHIFAKKYYMNSYIFGVSTLVGGYLCWVLLGLCIDVAKRVFKLVILQIVAPIPIMSIMDPKEGDKNKFKNWLTKLITTYIEIFIKLGVLYLVILLIQQIVTKGLFENYPSFSDSVIRTALLTVALIIGLFKFAAEAPKFITDALGLQSGGMGGEMARMGRTAAAATAGFAGGMLHGNAMAGMADAAHEAYQSDGKKPVHAFHKGAETAARISTGDSKREVGMAASLKRAAGARHGYSTRAFQEYKNRAKVDEQRASAAEDNAAQWDQNVGRIEQRHEANLKAQENAQRMFDSRQGASDFASWHSSLSQADQDRLAAAGVTDDASLSAYTARTANAAKASGSALRGARANQSAAHTAAANARATAAQSKKDQEKYEKVMQSYGQSGGYDHGWSGRTYRATQAVGRGIHQVERGAMNAAESIPVVGEAARTIDSAHQTHILNEIERGERGAELGEVDNRRSTRETLDNDGTLQARAADFMDSQFGPDRHGNPHDGHMGNG